MMCYPISAMIRFVMMGTDWSEHRSYLDGARIGRNSADYGDDGDNGGIG